MIESMIANKTKRERKKERRTEKNAKHLLAHDNHVCDCGFRSRAAAVLLKWTVHSRAECGDGVTGTLTGKISAISNHNQSSDH